MEPLARKMILANVYVCASPCSPQHHILTHFIIMTTLNIGPLPCSTNEEADNSAKGISWSFRPNSLLLKSMLLPSLSCLLEKNWVSRLEEGRQSPCDRRGLHEADVPCVLQRRTSACLCCARTRAGSCPPSWPPESRPSGSRAWHYWCSSPRRRMDGTWSSATLTWSGKAPVCAGGSFPAASQVSPAMLGPVPFPTSLMWEEPANQIKDI